MDYLVAKKCPLCDQYAVGGMQQDIYGGWICTYGWVFRKDLVAAVCPRCNRDLGPDTWHIEMLRKSHMEDAVQGYLDNYAFQARFGRA